MFLIFYLYCYYAILEDRPRYHLARYHSLQFHGMCRCGYPLDVPKASSEMNREIKLKWPIAHILKDRVHIASLAECGCLTV